MYTTSNHDFQSRHSICELQHTAIRLSAGNQTNTNKKRKSIESSSLQLTLVVKSGKFALGVNQAIKCIRAGQAKLVIVASNLPTLVCSQIEYLCMLSKIPVNRYQSNSRELGIALGKSYNVGVIAITDPGDADLKSFQ